MDPGRRDAPAVVMLLAGTANARPGLIPERAVRVMRHRTGASAGRGTDAHPHIRASAPPDRRRGRIMPGSARGLAIAGAHASHGPARPAQVSRRFTTLVKEFVERVKGIERRA